MAFVGALELLRIGHQGLVSNLWGLACPFYCTSPSAGSFVAFLLSGFILGCICGAVFTYWVLAGGIPAFPRPAAQAPEQEPPRRRSRLAGYLHE